MTDLARTTNAAPSLLPERPPRYEVNATVVSHERIIRHEFEMVFYAPQIARAARPGQFLELLYNDSYAPLVRRPFSLYRVDREAGTFSILYLARGSFTSGLAQKRSGDVVSILGPLGRPFTWPHEPEARHILVAGGIGAPPLYFLASEICRERLAQNADTANVLVLNGARTKDLLVGLVEFGGLNIVLHALTDDGTHGRQGLVTDFLLSLLDEDRDTPTCVSACGPTPMLRAVAEIATTRNLPCQISVETPMPCGIGTCNGCAIAVHEPESEGDIRYALACWDGPVFAAETLVW